MNRTLRLLLLHGLLTAPAFAQFVNRATWLGSADEDVRRDFAQGSDYFLDRASYVLTPPWWNPGLQCFQNVADWRFGSTSSTQFTVEGHLDHHVPLGSGLSFRYHVLQSETRDTRFLRNEMALEYETSETTAVFAQGSIFADKSLIDVSLGAWLWREEDDAVRVMLTAVDWTSEKSRVVDYVREPWAAMVSGCFGDPSSVRVMFDVGAQLPLEQRDVDDGDRLELHRTIGRAESHFRLAEHDVLVTAIEAERTDKDLAPLAAADPRTEQFDRTFWQVRAEWWRDARWPWSAGVLHTWNDEDGERPFDAAATLRTVRREWLLLARTQWAIDEQLSFEPHLFAGHVRDEFRDGSTDRREEGFQGKVAWNTRWDFSPAATLVAVVSLQLDEFAFGGGGVQFVARF